MIVSWEFFSVINADMHSYKISFYVKEWRIKQASLDPVSTVCLTPGAELLELNLTMVIVFLVKRPNLVNASLYPRISMGTVV